MLNNAASPTQPATLLRQIVELKKFEATSRTGLKPHPRSKGMLGAFETPTMLFPPQAAGPSKNGVVPKHYLELLKSI